MKNFIIALDGPAGSGKSTIAKIISKRMNLTYLDTGAMYRMVALYVKENRIDDYSAIETHFNNIDMDIVGERFFLNGRDVSEEIRTPEVTKIVSPISAIKCVREKLVKRQREISRGKSVILDGRDIGTVVFPNADLKIFLVASSEERAKRRLEEYQKKGIAQNFSDVLADIKQRDYIDMTRKESPLKKADDAIEIDTTKLSIDEVVDNILDLINRKVGE